jgi:hypothetical protein
VKKSLKVEGRIMKKTALDATAIVLLGSFFATPAFAGMLFPAPVAGVGIGALVVIGIGYRALRKRIDN